MKNIILYIISLIFSAMIILTIIIENNVNDFMIDFNSIYFISILLISIIVFILLKYIFKYLTKKEINNSKNIWSIKKITFIAFISIFMTGLLFLIVHYPGTCMVDTLQLLVDPIGYSFQYPYLYSLLFSTIYNTFYHLFNSMNIAFFLMNFVQLIFMCIILTYIIRWSHKTFKSNLLTLIIIIYFNLPIFANYNVTNLRDTLYAAFILLLIPHLYKIINTKGTCLKEDKFKVKLIITLGLLTLIRNNALFMIIILLLVLLIRYKKYYKNLLLISLCILIISSIPFILLKKNNVTTLYQESVAVPLQQLFYLANNDLLDDSDEEYINNLIYIPLLKERYSPYSVDNLKWNTMFDHFYLNETQDKFMKIWIKNAKKYPKEYLKAYLLNTYGLWSIHIADQYESRFLEIFINDTNMLQYYDELENTSILPDRIQNTLSSYYYYQTEYINNGAIFWIYVFLFMLMIYKKRKKYLLLYIPFICIWINLMVAAPLSSAFRYMCPLGYALPFLVEICFLKRIDCN